MISWPRVQGVFVTRRSGPGKRVLRRRSHEWLLVAAFGVGSAFAPAGRAGALSPERPATRLLGLSAEAFDGGVRLRVQTDGRLERFAVFELQDPRRLVIDLFELRDAETPAHLAVGAAEISQLRVGRHPERIRIVADAAAALPPFVPIVTPMSDGLVVEITIPRGDDVREPSPAAPTDANAQISAADRAFEAASTETVAAPREAPVPVPQSREAGTRVAQPREAEAQAAPADVHLELDAGRRRIGASLPRGMERWQRWKRELDVGSGTGSSGWGDESHPGMRASQRQDGGLAALADWEPGALADNRIRVGLFDGRFRLTTRYARSRYDASVSERHSLQGTDLDRLLDPAGVVGEAFSGRLDGTLGSWGPARVEGFASFQRVDPLFAWSEKDASQDPFARSGRRRLETGGAIRSGPFALVLSRVSEQAEVGASRSERGPRRWSHRAVASASLAPLFGLDPGAAQHGLQSLAPDSAWIGVSQGRVAADGSRSEGAATRDWSAGLSWDGEGSSATLALWRSVYEGDGAAADWSGSGADLGYGFYGERFDLTAGLSAQHSLTDQPGYRASETSLGGFASFTVRPEQLLPISTTLTFDRYLADYGPSAAPLQTHSFGLRTGLDLSEILFPIEPWLHAHLRASYGAIWSTTRSGDAEETVLDHGPAVTLGFDF